MFGKIVSSPLFGVSNAKVEARHEKDGDWEGVAGVGVELGVEASLLY